MLRRYEVEKIHKTEKIVNKQIMVQTPVRSLEYLQHPVSPTGSSLQTDIAAHLCRLPQFLL